MKLLIALILGCSALPLTSWAYSSSERAYSDADHNIYGHMGFGRGGFVLGADYEYPFHKTYGLGGYFSMYSKDDENGAPGLTALGVFIRPHFHRRSWEFYLSPGFGLLMYDGKYDDETALGPVFALGLTYQVTRDWAFGVESQSLYGWFADKARGQVESSLLAKVRYGL